MAPPAYPTLPPISPNIPASIPALNTGQKRQVCKLPLLINPGCLIGVDQPLWEELSSFNDAREFCDKVGYPVLVSPSYVISVAAMNVVSTEDDLANYLNQAAEVSRDHPVVISKYIEQAKEIEMDTVAKDAKMVMHYISEHDLDLQTVKQIVDVTSRIGNVPNVAGPSNIQFVVKNNESKVIELYPDLGLSANYVGVKVPQFSFSRLFGANPVLGVEMASTGEVACFGQDKYDAYLKALISTGIVPPKKDILFSVGRYREKLEILPPAQKLSAVGYNIFATSGTADFFTEHGVPCKYLKSLGEGDHAKQKSDYSLTQHLINMCINLPSKNHYHRPASYSSKGHHTRRMAVDFAIPLVTNEKNAKMLTEALIHKLRLDILSLDSKTSHRMHSFPGLINIGTFVPDLGTGGKGIAQTTEVAISTGFTLMEAGLMHQPGQLPK
ncbi:hypothetical protein D9619_013123 [Psilocybe cf. subviscida]|uniref:carbamoyl-phosphate synthase (ammonia) n=1 Tax=Psilocybe cf. subviscida TaxID=2480587 RepID=A0A8H5EVC2_9AGAR|nr:hypothetical protein D9619_013123 [Psilocybe cf. subviscida]